MSGLGDRRPSQLMDEMLALLGDHPPCFLFEELFKQQLPPDLRMQLATADFTDPRALAQQADALWASRPQPVVAAAAASTASRTSASNDSAAGPRRPPQRRHNQSASSLCFYHETFGAQAKKCRAPCSFQGNGSTGRQ
jgi:hypothetical protein